MSTCKYCNSTFSSKYALKSHIKNAKYCLNLRGELKTALLFKCNYCDKKLSSQSRLKTHYTSCIKYNIFIETKSLHKIIAEQKKQISVLQDKLENIALRASTKPTTVNNTQK